MKNELKLKPKYCACVSGGKDSLLMLQTIIKNPSKYPLDYVVHYELEIDYPFIKDVVNEMEKMCNQLNVPLLRIKPRESWYDLYNKKNGFGNIYGMPTRVTRWCNSQYKMDAMRQMKEWLKSQGCEMISYIGYCVDEVKRYENRKAPNEVYPLVIEGIEEKYIKEWASKQPIFNNYYKFFDRCGCMFCPFVQYVELAYILKYYPGVYADYIRRLKETEEIRESEYGVKFSVRQGNPKYNWEYTDNIVRTKWLKKLEEKENEYERS